MTAYLPPALLSLFKPADPLKYIPPADEEAHARRYPSRMSGVSQYLSLFEDPKDTPAPTRGETTEERRARKAKAKEERIKADMEAKKAAWDPHTDPNAQDSDAFKTLFVGRLHYDVDEGRLEKEFDMFGPIKMVRIVRDTNGKSRGMAFVEFEHEEDMQDAFKRGDGKKIEGKRVVVDVERGRTVKNWLPRRLGGGLGATRRGAPHECIKISGRVDSTPRSLGPPEPGRRSGEPGYRGGYSDRRPSADYDRDRRGSSRGYGSTSSRYDDRGRRSHDRDLNRRSSRDRGGYGGSSRDYDRRDDHRDRDRGYDDYHDRDRRRY